MYMIRFWGSETKQKEATINNDSTIIRSQRDWTIYFTRVIPISWYLYCKTAMESAQEKNTVLVGEDMDLFVPLRFYICLDSQNGEKEEHQKTLMESEDH